METAIRKEESENLSKEDESVQFLHIRDYYILHFFFYHRFSSPSWTHFAFVVNFLSYSQAHNNGVNAINL